MMRKTRDPLWNEEFQFMLEEPPLGEKIHFQVMSHRSGFGFRSKVLPSYIFLIVQFYFLPLLQY